MKYQNVTFPVLKGVIRDFRFWVLLFFVLRLYGITFPPIETNHAWRQTFTCMVARNFLEKDPNILLPRTDLAGARPDVVACEFPLYNYLIFIAAKIFGYQHWYGRLINLIISSIGVYCFFLLVRRYFGERTALFSGIILLSSMWFMFSRKIMPDTFSVSLVFAALWCVTRYTANGKWPGLFLFGLLGLLGGLSKIPSVIIFSLSLIVLVDRSTTWRRRLGILMAFAVAGLAITSWYFAWEPHLLDTYRNQLYFPRGFSQGIRELWEQGRWTLDKFTFASLRSYVALLFFLSGLFFMMKTGNRLLMAILAVSLPLLFFFMIKAGFVFATHDYYSIPFVPVMALVAGFGLASFKPAKYFWIFLVIIAAEGITNQLHDFRMNPSKVHLLNLEQIADKVCPRSEKIAITGGLNPEEIYFAHRKGWGIGPGEISNPAYINDLKAQGCRFLFISRKVSDEFPGYRVVYRDRDYVVYRLD